jgi:hypothetical protein
MLDGEINGVQQDAAMQHRMMLTKVRPECKDRLRTALAQVNELHHFKVNGPQ